MFSGSHIKKKLEEIAGEVESIIQILPNAVEWKTKVQEYRLTSQDVKEILQKAFAHHELSLKPQTVQNGKPILGIARDTLLRARELKGKTKDSASQREQALCQAKKSEDKTQRERAVLQMVAYTSMEVSRATREASHYQRST